MSIKQMGAKVTLCWLFDQMVMPFLTPKTLDCSGDCQTKNTQSRQSLNINTRRIKFEQGKAE